MKGVKDGIEGLPDVVLNTVGIIHGRAATGILLGNYIEVPYELEGAFGVLLTYMNLVDCVLEVVDELLTLSWSKFHFKGIENEVKCSFGLLAPRGTLRGFVADAGWVLLKHEVGSLERRFEAFQCFLSILSVVLQIVCCE